MLDLWQEGIKDFEDKGNYSFTFIFHVCLYTIDMFQWLKEDRIYKWEKYIQSQYTLIIFFDFKDIEITSLKNLESQMNNERKKRIHPWNVNSVRNINEICVDFLYFCIVSYWLASWMLFLSILFSSSCFQFVFSNDAYFT